MDNGLERRVVELRADPDGRRLSGVAVRYGDIAPGFSERFEAGAFGDVGAADVVLNVQHERGRAIARTGGGGMVLEDGADALRMAVSLPVTREADDTLALVRAGVLRGLSVEFRPIAEREEGGVRVIERAALSGMAVVDRPAYPASTVAARAAGAPGRRTRWR